MKKITLSFSLFFLFIGSMLFAQSITTGVVDLSTTSGLEMTAEIVVSPTEVTLTITGPDDRWLGVSLNGTSMFSSADVVIYDGTNLTDRFFNNTTSTPSLDTQDWSISSNTTSSGVRTLIASRTLAGSDGTDHTFSNTDTSINLAWARRAGASFSLGNHGENKGFVGNITYGAVLSVDEYSLASFTMYPNPTNNFLNVGLPYGTNNAYAEVYNFLGARVLSNNITKNQNKLNTSNLAPGVYVLKLSSDGQDSAKKFVVR